MSERRKTGIIIGISAAVVIIALVGVIVLVLMRLNRTSDFSPFESDDIIIVEDHGSGLLYFEHSNNYYSVDKTNHTRRSLTDEEYAELAAEVLSEREKSDLEIKETISGLDIDLVHETEYWDYKLFGNCIYITPLSFSDERYMYKYDIAADSVERITIEEDFDSFRNFDFFVAEEQYPDISGCADETIENFTFCDKSDIGKSFVYLDGERIFFQLYNKMGKNGLLDNYLYEYFPESNTAEFVSKFSHSSGSRIEEIISLD
ncbi:MAG: hypothetical protein K2J76_02240 [Oscillospiraceae bacterium]|nr:hypothetical protein [Oscillospiraceae bacterium]